MNELQTIAGCLSQADKILLLTHARPDGDGLGAIAALARSAVAAGKRAELLVPDRVPERYAFLFSQPPAGPERFAELADAADVIVVIDTCARAQLDGVAQAVVDRRDKVLVVDHHATTDAIAAVQWVDASAAAAGVMVAELIQTLHWPVDVTVAEALLASVTSDTGWLQFANTDARCLRQAAWLLEHGVRPDKLYRRLFQCDRPERLALVARMLASLRVECEGRLASMVIRREDFEHTGARGDETENLVNEALRIGAVDTALLLVETDSGEIRVSLRSRDAIDVAAIAKPFGGGGHTRAAGVRATMNIDDFREKLTQACAEKLGRF
ncbi:MAG: bifunctional oligoribonuclease/PAP phosphatase NrnA [Phycisphaerae bacterium]|nr:bifunctional oligoribonuclease/PAP phosphatase NrnA [Phycisphaerae bacterium]